MLSEKMKEKEKETIETLVHNASDSFINNSVDYAE